MTSKTLIVVDIVRPRLSYTPQTLQTQGVHVMSLTKDHNLALIGVGAEQRNPSPADFIVHVPVLRRYARTLVHNIPDAEDLVQDSLVRGLSRLHLFQPGTNLKSWLLSILHNIFVDQIRKAKRSREFTQALILMEEGTITRPNQFHRIELSEADRALSKLPAGQRSALLKISIDGLTYAEAAAATGVEIGTVRSRLSRGRAALAARLDGESISGPDARRTSPALATTLAA